MVRLSTKIAIAFVCIGTNFAPIFAFAQNTQEQTLILNPQAIKVQSDSNLAQPSQTTTLPTSHQEMVIENTNITNNEEHNLGNATTVPHNGMNNEFRGGGMRGGPNRENGREVGRGFINPTGATNPMDGATPTDNAQMLGNGEEAPNTQTTNTQAPNTQAPNTQATTAVTASMPHDLSPLGMFLAADKIVKAVMIGLALASIATWTIWLVKTLELTNAKRRARVALKSVNNAENLHTLYSQMKAEKGMGSALVIAAQREVEVSLAAIDVAGSDGLKERLSSVLSRLVAGAGRRIAVGTGILATIGAIGPFVGLFGTVWGIMNSFIGISQAQTTNLAVVAPGIAEALLATAIGLVAAIPAVIIYNIFARSITSYRQQLVDVSAGIERLVSRDLDFRKLEKQTNISMSKSAKKAVTIPANADLDLSIAAE